MMIPRLSAAELVSRPRKGFSAETPIAARIIQQVKMGGDCALLALTREYDKAELSVCGLRISPAEIGHARDTVPSDFLEAVRRAVHNVKVFHEAQRPCTVELREPLGAWLRQAYVPLDRVGIYVPGGRAAYPSSVVMTAVPARVAGVREVIMCTPPGPDGCVNPYTLAVAAMCGVDHVFKVGGAQAVAAMAYGTESIPRVDKIVGPGNAFVTAAKALVQADVGIDMLAGPSEIAIIADDTADPEVIAADMIAQAEHDPLAIAVLITDSEALAQCVDEETSKALSYLPRQAIAAQALRDNGAIVVVDNLRQAVDVVNSLSPEHVEIATRQCESLGSMVRNAGTIFLGHYSAEAMGDYVAGPNHVLPTSGTARFRGTLSTWDFVKPVNIVRYDRRRFAEEAPHAVVLAEAEGLHGHGRSVAVRLRSMEHEVGLSGEGHLIKLDANESPYDLPTSIKEKAVRALVDIPLHRYPTADSDALRQALADRVGVSEDMVVVGVGSDEMLQIIIMAKRPSIRRVVMVHPTFVMYRAISSMLGMEVVEIPLGEDFEFDVEAVASHMCTPDSLGLFCTPNNPTGTSHALAIRALIERTQGMVVVDEAYSEFSGETLMDCLSDRVIILRTMSKAMGLAGLRVGYSVSTPDTAKFILKHKLPFNCNSISESLAIEAIRNRAYVDQVVRSIVAERERVYTEMAAMGVTVYPSCANFLLFETQRPASEVHKGLLDLGVSVRAFDRLPNHLRVTIGLPYENDAFLKALSKVQWR